MVCVVYVSIYDLVFDERVLAMDMLVVGVTPNSTKEVMDFLTRAFSRLEFDYTRASGRLAVLGQYISDLARGKFFITRVPENTNILIDHASLEDAVAETEERGENVVDLFIDAGSPFRYIYIVKRGYPSNPFTRDALNFRIIGLGYPGLRRVSIFVDFTQRLRSCLSVWCTEEFLEEVEELARGSELHIVAHPDMEWTKRRLVEEALRLSRAFTTGGLAQ
ncbi:MAG: hypothetical protein RQ842_05815 [Vulcanisaeta sp.]|nr:hypothetical protein [Vulcanisaeta sp.]